MASADETMDAFALATGAPATPENGGDDDPVQGARIAPDDDAAQTPERIGGYRVLDRLDAGGFGAVFRAEPEGGGAPVAIKVLHAELVASRTAVARFEQEVVAIRRVRHPGVVDLRDAGELEDGRRYFVMELLSGVSLERHLALRGRLPVAATLEILAPLCSALEAAHAEGVVHRDIKASNIFLCGEGEARRVVLLDFGVAKLVDLDAPGITASRQLVGTPTCMAPEQILGRAVDERTDVYALGALVYRMLTGELPFAARSLITLQQMHLYAAPRAPSALAPLAPSLDGPVLRALSKSAADRQAGPRALYDELAAAARGVQPEPQRALVVLVEARVDPAAMENPEDALLADLDGALEAAIAALQPFGLRVALETGTSVLLARAQRPGPEDRTHRRGVAAALAALSERLAARAGRDPRVDVRLYLHTGGAVLGADGTLVSGDLLRLGWVPELDAEGAPDPARARGPVASESALADLGDLEVRRAGVWEGVGWLELRATPG